MRIIITSATTNRNFSKALNVRFYDDLGVVRNAFLDLDYPDGGFDTLHIIFCDSESWNMQKTLPKNDGIMQVNVFLDLASLAPIDGDALIGYVKRQLGDVLKLVINDDEVLQEFMDRV